MGFHDFSSSFFSTVSIHLAVHLYLKTFRKMIFKAFKHMERFTTTNKNLGPLVHLVQFHRNFTSLAVKES